MMNFFVIIKQEIKQSTNQIVQTQNVQVIRKAQVTRMKSWLFSVWTTQFNGFLLSSMSSGVIILNPGLNQHHFLQQLWKAALSTGLCLMLRSPMRKGRSGLREAGNSALFPHGIRSSLLLCRNSQKWRKSLPSGSWDRVPCQSHFISTAHSEKRNYIWSTMLHITRYWCQMARKGQLAFLQILLT